MHVGSSKKRELRNSNLSLRLGTRIPACILHMQKIVLILFSIRFDFVIHDSKSCEQAVHISANVERET
jgi:hypothetical protein